MLCCTVNPHAYCGGCDKQFCKDHWMSKEIKEGHQRPTDALFQRCCGRLLVSRCFSEEKNYYTKKNKFRIVYRPR